VIFPIQELFIKVCGITNIADAELACSLGVNAIGFNFKKSSNLYITPERAAAIVESLPEHISKIGVFENANRRYISDICKRVPLSAVQLLGTDGPDDLVGFETSVIKVFQLDRTFDVEVMRNYLVDAFLLMNKSEEVSYQRTKEYHWDIAIRAKEFGRIILSGGLNPNNIEDAVRFVQPYGVSVREGIEAKPGKVDKRKLSDFIAKARNASLICNTSYDME
jgi:phosphoribosylanthranilate isomerase